MQYEAMFDPNSVVVCDVMCDLACNAGIYVAFIWKGSVNIGSMDSMESMNPYRVTIKERPPNA